MQAKGQVTKTLATERQATENPRTLQSDEMRTNQKKKQTNQQWLKDKLKYKGTNWQNISRSTQKRGLKKIG